MPRALDHLVIAFRDLGLAAERYRGLGFRVGPRNRHPWGTENQIVQLDGVYSRTDRPRRGLRAARTRRSRVPVCRLPQWFSCPPRGAGDGRAAFGRRRGGSARVRSRRFWGPDPVRFRAQRGARRPRGRVWPSRSTFARIPALPEAGFFACQHKHPENFWDAAAQVHPNGATGVTELAFVHPEPEAVRGIFSTFFEAEALPAPGGFRFALSNVGSELPHACGLCGRVGRLGAVQRGMGGTADRDRQPASLF